MQTSEAICLNQIAETLQSSRMKNAIFPQMSSQIYNFGHIATIAELPMQIDQSKLSTIYDNNLYMHSNLCNNEDQFSKMLALYSQPPITYQPVSLTSLDDPCSGSIHQSCLPIGDNFHQQLLPLNISLSVQENNNNIQAKIRNKKRPINAKGHGHRANPNVLVDNYTTLSTEWTATKKMAVCPQEQWHCNQVLEERKEFRREKVPARRSQKLADKITALQKLVSPYGKTDTASVLHEACISIEVLQEQIQNLCAVLSKSSSKTDTLPSEGNGEHQADLQSKGLCLVSSSLANQLIIEEDPFYQHSRSLNAFMH